jgi:hypothetical protein
MILPEMKCPSSAGQKFITISPTRLLKFSSTESWPRVVIHFNVALSQRIRNIPNDRFGTIYTDDQEMTDIHNAIVNIIESLEMLEALRALVSPQPTIEDASIVTLYGITRRFVHHMTTLDPIHLYPSDFGTNTPGLDAKIVGYRTYSTFSSPSFFLLDNPLTC